MRRNHTERRAPPTDSLRGSTHAPPWFFVKGPVGEAGLEQTYRVSQGPRCKAPRGECGEVLPSHLRTYRRDPTRRRVPGPVRLLCACEWLRGRSDQRSPFG